MTQKYRAFMAGSGDGVLGGVLASRGALGGHCAKAGSGSPLDLHDYVTKETMNGLFTVIGEREQSIRSNPAARTTEPLKTVFGGK